MDAINLKNKDIKSHWSLFKNLSIEAKLELVALLINSIKNDNINKPEKEEDILDRLNGAWKDDDETAEELIGSIRTSRVSNLNH